MATEEPSDDLTLLGNAGARPPERPVAAALESFPNRHAAIDYRVTLDCPQFTSLCPVTQQPDFGRIVIEYVPDARCVETKSLKLYLHAYRNENAFNEVVVNRILEDLVAAVCPRWMRVRGEFASRGGISVTVEACHPPDRRGAGAG